MLGAYLRRGLAAGLLAGLLAGVVAFVAGEPGIDDAIAIEEAAAAEAAPAAGVHEEAGGGLESTRGQQRAGLIAGYGLVGAAGGLVFGLGSAWAVGRVRGGGWPRSLKLGAAAVGVLVAVAVKYPANPPAVGDPDTVTVRTLSYVGAMVLGVLVALIGWAAGRQLAAGSRLPVPVRQALVGAGVAVLAVVLAVALPAAGGALDGFPPELLWRFRLSALASQVVLVAGTAVAFGLLTSRSEGAAVVDRLSPARAG